MIIVPTKEEKRLFDFLEEKDSVKNVEYQKRFYTNEIYISTDVQLGGINLWELHEKFDVDVVCSWHDPTKGKQSMCFRVSE